jgi:beta-phosphoglucomutase
MIEAIFFDFNGVIIDDERLQLQAYQEVLQKQNLQLTKEQYFASLGMDDRSFVRALFQQEGKKLTDETLLTVLAEKAVCHRTLIADELPLFPGVVTFLKATSRGYSLGLVSMASHEEIRYVLERSRLGSLFSVIVSAEDVNVCKPAPHCYRQALEKLNQKRRAARLLPLLSHECLVIEDSPPGIYSGREAGMRTLGVTNTVSERQLRLAGAEVVTASLADWTVEAVLLVFNDESRTIEHGV